MNTPFEKLYHIKKEVMSIIIERVRTHTIAETYLLEKCDPHKTVRTGLTDRKREKIQFR